MCGRFAFFSPREAITEAFGAGAPDDIAPRFNIAPTQDVHCLLADESGAVVWRSLRWGLIPFWAKDPQIGNRMINARAETVGEKPGFRSSYKRRRCIVLATGFYEWRKDAQGKTPWYISRDDEQPLAFAGLWDSWEKGDDGTLYTCTILTTRANRFMQDLHHRMPVILETPQVSEWIAADTSRTNLDALALAETEPPLQAWAVSRTVNSPRNDGPELVQPVS